MPSRSTSSPPPSSRAQASHAQVPAAAGQLTESPASNFELIRRLLALAWRFRIGCLRVLTQQLILTGLALAGLGLTGLGIDVLRHAVSPDAAAPSWPLGIAPPAAWHPFSTVAAVAVAILGVAVFHAVIRYWSTLSAAYLVQDIVVQLRAEVYAKLQQLSFRFYDANETGSIINRVSGDVQAVRSFVDGVVIQLLSVLLSLLVYLAYMLSVHVPLTLACLATTPLLAVGAAMFSRWVRPAYVRNRALSDKMVLALSENVQGAHVVKGFAREQDEIEKFQAANRAIRDQKHQIFWYISLFQPAMGLMTQINMLVLLGYGGWLVIHGQLRLGEGLFVFANLLYQFANQVGQITNITNSIQASLTGAQRVFEVLDAPVEIESPQNAVRLPRARGAVRFEHVSFAYQPGQPVLDDVSFSVEPGQCVAIVGATGAGKTTLLSLLARFYDPTAGKVTLDGFDLRSLDLDDLRRNIGIVFQESFLFSNTVHANIAFGHPTATMEQVETAARIAASHQFVSELQHGYQTVIGEHGSNLSGGQRQRMAIARAMLLEPAILILDDPTAAIDSETEHEIMEAMENAMRGRTTFVIAHRTSTLRRADLVLVLDNGRIVQRGTHDELMKHPGHYRQAALLQLLDDEHDLVSLENQLQGPHLQRVAPRASLATSDDSSSALSNEVQP